MEIKKVYIQSYDNILDQPQLEQLTCFCDDLFYYSYNDQQKKWACIDKDNGMVVMWGDDLFELIKHSRDKIQDYYEIKKSKEYKKYVESYHKLLLKNIEEENQKKIQKENLKNNKRTYHDGFLAGLNYAIELLHNQTVNL